MAARMLSPRLLKIAGLADGSTRLWDVGSDHGMLPAWMIANGRIESAIASDIRKGPLDSARRTARAFGVDGQIRFLLCDGLNAPEEDRSEAFSADAIVIAGMGGGMIAEILASAGWVCDRSVRLLLQPMSSAEDLRKFLYEGCYTVLAEHRVREGKKAYLIIEAKGGGTPEAYDLADTRIGKQPLRDAQPFRDAYFCTYVDREIRRLKNELHGAAAECADDGEKDGAESPGRTRTERINDAIRKMEMLKGDAGDGNNTGDL